MKKQKQDELDKAMKNELDKAMKKAMKKMVDKVKIFLSEHKGIKEQEDGTILFMSHAVLGEFMSNNMKMILDIYTTIMNDAMKTK